MAHDGTTGVPDPMEAVASPPGRGLSRYRTLRGKSITSLRDLDVGPSNGTAGRDEAAPSSSSPLRSRSRSLTSFRRALKRQESGTVGEGPSMPWKTKVLSPKPINVAAQSKLRMLDRLRSPALVGEHAARPSLAGVPESEAEPDQELEPEPEPEPAGGPGAMRAMRAMHCHLDVHDEMHGDGHGSGHGSSPAAKTMGSSGPHMHHAREMERLQSPLQSPLPASVQSSPHRGVSRGVSRGAPATARDRQCASPSSDAQAKEPSCAPEPAPDSETGRGGQVLLADEVARLEAETDRILAEQKKLDLARIQAQPVTTSKPKRLIILQKLSFFSRTPKRATAAAAAAAAAAPGRASQPSTPSTIVSAIFSPTLSRHSRNSSVEEPPTPPAPAPAPSKMSFIEPGGKGIVPQTDAPISAINGGERRVVVRCLSSTISLPVTADTSPMDIVTATVEMTRHQLTPATCVIIECYTVLGLERRLRRYERIRDVMNSWDRDLQNSLLIMSCDATKDDEPHLEIESVPRTEEPPCGFSMPMHHSSKPGKWNKRWVTLLDNGQIYAAKSADAQPCDKDSSVLCHLTDFDIYTPKESEMRRHLRPPNRLCYAIKSQQKTVVFPNGENFVHFFSTEDAEQAAFFYEKVHAWRSWYMVNRMVHLGEKKDKPPQPPQPMLDA
ncbi:hypothetical protein E4U42_006140, partial [Claviceps africana]